MKKDKESQTSFCTFKAFKQLVCCCFAEMQNYIGNIMSHSSDKQL